MKYSFSTIKNVKHILSSQAIQRQVAGWIWQMSRSLPTSALKGGNPHHTTALPSHLYTFDPVALDVWITLSAAFPHEGPCPAHGC